MMETDLDDKKPISNIHNRYISVVTGKTYAQRAVYRGIYRL